MENSEKIKNTFTLVFVYVWYFGWAEANFRWGGTSNKQKFSYA